MDSISLYKRFYRQNHFSISELLQLVTVTEWFATSYPVSRLVVRIDELLDANDSDG